jgi:membrane associated rhomboid family serine protease
MGGFHYNHFVLHAMEKENTGELRDRVLTALLELQVSQTQGGGHATLVAVHEPLALLEWPGEGKGLVLLDHAAIPPEDLRGHVDRVIHAHDKGLLFLALVGGDNQVRDTLRAADKESHDRDRLGVYHIDEKGQPYRVAGRRLPELERALRQLPPPVQLNAQDFSDLIRRGQKERQEAIDFVGRISHRIPHLTLAIIALCFLFYVITSGGDDRARRLFDLFANTPAALKAGEVWRLLTYAFLHSTAGPMHLLVNMLSLFSLGGFLEPILGKRRLGLLYFTTAVIGGLASVLSGHAKSVGASGAVWGLLGATMGLASGQQGFFPGLIARGMRQRLGVVLVINIAISFLPGIDFACHIGGGLSGYLLGRFGFLGKRPRMEPAQSNS